MPCGSTVKLRLGVIPLLAGLVISVQSLAFGVGNGAVRGEQSSWLWLQGTVVCFGCYLNEVQEEQPAQAEAFTQLSQGEDKVVLQVQDISAPAGENALAWPPPQVRVRAAGRLVDTLGAAAQRGQGVTISGLLHSDQTLEVTDVALSG